MQIKLEDNRLKSQLMASIEAFRWWEDHNGTALDRDGMLWNLEYRRGSKMNPDDTKTILWQLVMQLRLTTDARGLVQAKILHEKEDARLLGLLGELSISFALKPLEIVAASEEFAIRKAKLELPGYLAKLQSSSLLEYKREAVGRFVDDSLKFGEALHRL